MITNISAIISIVMVTNREPLFIHPSGEEKIIRTIVSEVHSTTYTIEDRVYILRATNHISTNITRMIWAEVPLSRQPLSVKDFPSPVNRTGVKTDP